MAPSLPLPIRAHLPTHLPSYGCRVWLSRSPSGLDRQVVVRFVCRYMYGTPARMASKRGRVGATKPSTQQAGRQAGQQIPAGQQQHAEQQQGEHLP